MKFLLRFVVKTFFFLGMVFVFLVVFQHGTKHFSQGAQQEWTAWKGFPAFVQQIISPSSPGTQAPLTPNTPVTPATPPNPSESLPL